MPHLTPLLLACCLAVLSVARAQDVPPTAEGVPPAASSASAASSAAASAESSASAQQSSSDDEHSADTDENDEDHGWRDHDNVIVSFWRDATLPAGQHADSVVSIIGSSTAAGDVDQAVVAILGSSHVTGHVGDSVVAVLGNAYVNSRVENGVVAVMGNVELGPKADVDGDVTVIGGQLIRDPGAIVHGGIQSIFGGLGMHMRWSHAWVERGLFYGRPLALGPGLGWAWGLAVGFLAFYVFLWLLFPAAIERCVTTFERHPGESLLMALAAILLVPIVDVLLVVTVIGIAAIPFLAVALVCFMLFGKAAILAWLGRRCLPFLDVHHSAGNTVLAVLVGGLIVLALYCVPVVGFIVFNLLWLLAQGVVLYTLLSVTQAARAAPPPFSSMPPPHTPPPQSPPPQTPPPHQPPPAGAFDPLQGQHARTSSGAQSSASAAGAAAAAGGAAAAAPINLLTLPRADFWPRIAALLLDVVLIGILMGWVHEHDPQLLLLAGYGAVMWKLKGATVGGLICGHRVVRVDGLEMDWPTVVVRALGCFLSLAVVGLGFIWIAVDPNHQAWHDKIAGTLVVRLPPGLQV